MRIEYELNRDIISGVTIIVLILIICSTASAEAFPTGWSTRNIRITTGISYKSYNSIKISFNYKCSKAGYVYLPLDLEKTNEAYALTCGNPSKHDHYCANSAVIRFNTTTRMVCNNNWQSINLEYYIPLTTKFGTYKVYLGFWTGSGALTLNSYVSSNYLGQISITSLCNTAECNKNDVRYCNGHYKVHYDYYCSGNTCTYQNLGQSCIYGCSYQYVGAECNTASICGDNQCTAGESCLSCPSDCGACCTDECSSGAYGVTPISGTQYYSSFKICGNYDSDSCLEWSSTYTCTGNTSWGSGQSLCQDNCGDKLCSQAENSNTCPADCGAPCDNSCTTNCPSGWTCRGNSCYRDVYGNWQGAFDTCIIYNSHLVTINDACENMWLKNTYATSWLSYNDRASEGNWVWAGSSSTYTNWASGEPNNSGDEDCAELTSSGYWNDASCSNNKKAVCELESPCPLSCDDGDSCTTDYCTTSGCAHSRKNPCINGKCDSWEDACTSPTECSYDCPACYEKVCVNNEPLCVVKENCCGNGLCEAGEDCNSCGKDCGCALSIDLSSVTCSVDGVDCSLIDDLNNKSYIKAGFNLNTQSNQGVSNVLITFKRNGVTIGSFTTNSAYVTYSFTLPQGRQNVQVHAYDARYNQDDEKVIFSIYVNGDEEFNEFTPSNPFEPNEGDEAGGAGGIPPADKLPGYIPGSVLLAGAAGISAYALLESRKKKDISGEAWYTKLARGWGYKFEQLGYDISNGLATFFNGVKNDYLRWANDNDSNNFINYFGNRVLDGLSYVGGSIANDYNSWGADKGVWGEWWNPVGWLGYAGTRLIEGVSGAASSYWTALNNNPIDTLSKTAIVLGGLLLAIPSGGSSLALALAVAGTTMAVAGTAGIIAEESYGYINASNEQLLYEDAVSDTDDLIWIGSGVLTSVMGAYQVKLVNNVRSQVYTKQLETHIIKHGHLPEFGNNLQTAQNQCSQAFRNGIPFRQLHNGIIKTAVYDPVNNVFISIGKGFYYTGFKPSGGLGYRIMHLVATYEANALPSQTALMYELLD